MNPISVGILGRGMISQYFVDALNHHPQIHLVASCDLSADRLKQDSARGLKTYTDPDLFFASSAIDVVIVCTPAHTHETLVTQALYAGKHVLCEKPLASNANQTHQLIELAHARNQHLFTAFHRRYNTHLQKAKRLIVTEQVVQVEAWYLENIRDHSPFGGWMSDAKALRKGCILDNGVNVFDALWELIGPLDVEEVSLKKPLKEPWESSAQISGSTHGGTTYLIHLDWNAPTEQKILLVTFASGERLNIDFLEGFSGFKSSLAHEYTSVVNDLVARLASEPIPDLQSQGIMQLTDRTYELAQTKDRL